MMQQPPFDVQIEIDGWRLFWAELELIADGDERLTSLLRRTEARARGRFDLKSFSSAPTTSRLRRLFRAAGCDPTRYRPSSEALLRRILKGGELPSIHPLVDISNCLSAELAVPCCVMTEGTFEPPLVFRTGRADESYQSLRGPFRLEGKPLLCDTRGPLDCPITGNERVKVTTETRRAWLVAYLPADVVDNESVREVLEKLVLAAPVVCIHQTAVS
jgi:DNA/RNA-binding domain of Phe-tRNA-synthetase-like protein